MGANMHFDSCDFVKVKYKFPEELNYGTACKLSIGSKLFWGEM